jgi:hypothetical protein
MKLRLLPAILSLLIGLSRTSKDQERTTNYFLSMERLVIWLALVCFAIRIPWNSRRAHALCRMFMIRYPGRWMMAWPAGGMSFKL